MMVLTDKELLQFKPIEIPYCNYDELDQNIKDYLIQIVEVGKYYDPLDDCVYCYLLKGCYCSQWYYFECDVNYNWLITILNKIRFRVFWVTTEESLLKEYEEYDI